MIKSIITMALNAYDIQGSGHILFYLLFIITLEESTIIVPDFQTGNWSTERLSNRLKTLF